mmetsp:Transcript_13635/g.33012  ORF Transcript_13635/g.33012 Transcript_13635/m.33012 type:complete len:219 (+) Transcript_13635:184-840(+)
MGVSILLVQCPIKNSSIRLELWRRNIFQCYQERIILFLFRLLRCQWREPIFFNSRCKIVSSSLDRRPFFHIHPLGTPHCPLFSSIIFKNNHGIVRRAPLAIITNGIAAATILPISPPRPSPPSLLGLGLVAALALAFVPPRIRRGSSPSNLEVGQRIDRIHGAVRRRRRARTGRTTDIGAIFGSVLRRRRRSGPMIGRRGRRERGCGLLRYRLPPLRR